MSLEWILAAFEGVARGGISDWAAILAVDGALLLGVWAGYLLGRHRSGRNSWRPGA